MLILLKAAASSNNWVPVIDKGLVGVFWVMLVNCAPRLCSASKLRVMLSLLSVTDKLKTRLLLATAVALEALTPLTDKV